MRLLKLLLWSCIAVVSAVLLSVSGAYLYLSPNLPSVESLRSVQLQIPLRIYSHDEKLIAEFGEMRRSPLRFEEIPQDFIDALLAAEDDGFAKHYGVDVKSLMRAASQLISTGQIQTGGSTITMQVAKNYFLTNERSFSRKITEILLALQIERELSKNEILELYVNKIYLGSRAYGIEAAAQVYYGKHMRDLTLSQMAMIAGLPKAPSLYNPLVNPQRAKIRRDWILERLYKLGRIDQARYQEALAEPIDARYHITESELYAPYVAEMARAEMVGRYGAEAYTEGFRVYTSVEADLQEAANQAVRQGLLEYDQRHGYRGPEQRFPGLDEPQWLEKLRPLRTLGGLEPAIVTQVDNDGIRILTRQGQQGSVAWDSMKWARPFLATNSMGPAPRQPSDVAKVGDLIRILRQTDGSLRFVQVPKAQSALVSLAPEDGAIKALVGGFSFEQSNYNRATQAKRQPGSSFKPFIYSAALDQGYSAASLMNDAPIVYNDPSQAQAWRPKNDTNTFLGPIRLREALYRSRNLVSIRLLQAIGIDYARDYISHFGLSKEDLPANLSLALGTATLTPLEITAAWSTFANGGYRIEPYLIREVHSRDGEVLFTHEPAKVPPASEQAQEEHEDLGIQAYVAAPADANTEAEGNAPRVAQRIIDERTAYIMTSMLQDVIRRGTGSRAQVLGRSDLAGKTGTTNESKDAWFSGYNADYVTSAWVGFDQPQSLGRREYGGTAALPIWINYMREALKGKPSHLPAEPKGIMALRIDPLTGRAATAATQNAFLELFKAEDSPPDGTEQGPGYHYPGSPLPADESAPMDLF